MINTFITATYTMTCDTENCHENISVIDGMDIDDHDAGRDIFNDINDLIEFATIVDEGYDSWTLVDGKWFCPKHSEHDHPPVD